VLVRANFDEARVWGLEWLGEFEVTNAVTVGTTYTYLRARDLTTDLPPNIEGGTPAPLGTLWVRYTNAGHPFWVEPYFTFAAKQSHLSTLDLGDRRTGANRTRSQIQNFFRNGARNRGWVDAGPDGIINNADDRLIATGETLLEVQNRVLGVGVNGAPMFTAVPAYNLFGIRFGMTHGRHSFLVDASNLTDENYRGISWGMDGPGRMITARYTIKY
jgi:hemoglobin/transferrin/lactoferrin receptor protein